MTKKTKLSLALLAVAFITISALGSVVWIKTRPPKSYTDMDAFSVAWKACPEEDRHKMLDWLLGHEAKRDTSYPIESSHLYGLSRDEVLQYLGPNQSAGGTTYFIGSIDNDFLGNLIVPKRDHLVIGFDTNGIVSRMGTTS